MILDVDRKSFVDGVLAPMSGLTERCIFTLADNTITGIGASADRKVFVLVDQSVRTTAPSGTELHVGDVKKLSRAVDSLSDDTPTGRLTFEITENALKYKGDGVKFSYHLWAKNMITKLPVSREKMIKMISAPTNKVFTLTPQKYNSILSGSYYTTETSKIYFYTEQVGTEHVLFCELGDKTRPNVDTFVRKLGPGPCLSKVLPFDVESLKILTVNGLSSAKDSSDVVELIFDESNGCMSIKIAKPEYTLIYFLAALIK